MGQAHGLILAAWGLPAFTWMVMWLVLATLTIVLLFLLRTRWSRSKPWRRYAILSLWVHVLLACATMTVRIVTGAPDSGEGETIRVAVVNNIVAQEQTTEEPELAEWELPSDQPLIAPDLSPPAPIEPDKVATPPDEAAISELTEQLTSEPLTPAPPMEAPALVDSPAFAEQTAPEPESSVSEPAEIPPQESESTQTKSAPPSEPTPPSTKPPVAETYANRFAENRQELTEQSGGSEQTERAVQAALAWLAAAQSANGGWDASKFGAGQERHVLGENRRGAGQNADTGVTGLALLAFLGSGSTHHHGQYTRAVADGLEYLRQRQRSDGALYGDAQVFARMYCHSMATFAVCEAYALTGDPRLQPVARAAMRYTLSMQHPSDGGWRYRRGDTGDTSQLGWQLMTLKSAELAGMTVPATTWSLVERYLRRVRRGETGGLASYRPESRATRTMTAEALFCRQLLTDNGYGGIHPAEVREALQWISQDSPSSSRPNLYYWYYATLALHRAKSQSDTAQTVWEDWNHQLTTALLTTQQEDGSWNADTTWGGYGGRVYTTALSAMCLEVYYRYSETSPPGEIARRPWQPVPY